MICNLTSSDRALSNLAQSFELGDLIVVTLYPLDEELSKRFHELSSFYNPFVYLFEYWLFHVYRKQFN
jgi:hypothetical protein